MSKKPKTIFCKTCKIECNKRGSNTLYCVTCSQKKKSRAKFQKTQCDKCGKPINRVGRAKYCQPCSDLVRKEKVRRSYYLRRGYTEDQIPPKGWKKKEAAKKREEKRKAMQEQRGMPAHPIERNLRWAQMAWEKKIQKGEIKVSEPSKEYATSIQRLLDLCDEDCHEDIDW